MPINKKCSICEKDFIAKKKDVKFCSNKCVAGRHSITNQKYGMLTALMKIRIDKQGRAVWLFRCDCGNEIEKHASIVKRNLTLLNCGCDKPKKVLAEKIKKICSTCSSTYFLVKSRALRSKYCSKICFDTSRTIRDERKCLKCGKDFTNAESRVQKYCSRDCFLTKDYIGNTKRCALCKEYKPVNSYGTRAKGLVYCKPCNVIKSREYQLKKKFGLTPDDLKSMILKQAGKCFICKTEAKLIIDHNHETGQLRGLICNSCNTGIGLLKDSVTVLEEAINYLKTFGSYTNY